MRRISVILAVTTEIIILILSIRLDPTYISNAPEKYGANGYPLIAASFVGEFLTILVVYWLLEKIYDKSKPKVNDPQTRTRGSTKPTT